MISFKIQEVIDEYTEELPDHIYLTISNILKENYEDSKNIKINISETSYLNEAINLENSCERLQTELDNVNHKYKKTFRNIGFIGTTLIGICILIIFNIKC